MKMKFRKVISLLLAATLIMSLFPASAFASEELAPGGNEENVGEPTEEMSKLAITGTPTITIDGTGMVTVEMTFDAIANEESIMFYVVNANALDPRGTGNTITDIQFWSTGLSPNSDYDAEAYGNILPIWAFKYTYSGDTLSSGQSKTISFTATPTSTSVGAAGFFECTMAFTGGTGTDGSLVGKFREGSEATWAQVITGGADDIIYGESKDPDYDIIIGSTGTIPPGTPIGDHGNTYGQGFFTDCYTDVKISVGAPLLVARPSSVHGVSHDTAGPTFVIENIGSTTAKITLATPNLDESVTSIYEYAYLAVDQRTKDGEDLENPIYWDYIGNYDESGADNYVPPQTLQPGGTVTLWPVIWNGEDEDIPVGGTATIKFTYTDESGTAVTEPLTVDINLRQTAYIRDEDKEIEFTLYAGKAGQTVEYTFYDPTMNIPGGGLSAAWLTEGDIGAIYPEKFSETITGASATKDGFAGTEMTFTVDTTGLKQPEKIVRTFTLSGGSGDNAVSETVKITINIIDDAILSATPQPHAVIHGISEDHYDADNKMLTFDVKNSGTGAAEIKGVSVSTKYVTLPDSTPGDGINGNQEAAEAIKTALAGSIASDYTVKDIPLVYDSVTDDMLGTVNVTIIYEEPSGLQKTLVVKMTLDNRNRATLAVLDPEDASKTITYTKENPFIITVKAGDTEAVTGSLTIKNIGKAPTSTSGNGGNLVSATVNGENATLDGAEIDETKHENGAKVTYTGFRFTPALVSSSTYDLSYSAEAPATAKETTEDEYNIVLTYYTSLTDITDDGVNDAQDTLTIPVKVIVEDGDPTYTATLDLTHNGAPADATAAATLGGVTLVKSDGTSAGTPTFTTSDVWEVTGLEAGTYTFKVGSDFSVDVEVTETGGAAELHLYTVKIDTSDKTIGTGYFDITDKPTTVTIEAGDSVALDADITTTGYTLGGWDVEPTGIGTVSGDYKSYTAPVKGTECENGITLTPKFTPPTGEISIDIKVNNLAADGGQINSVKVVGATGDEANWVTAQTDSNGKWYTKGTNYDLTQVQTFEVTTADNGVLRVDVPANESSTTLNLYTVTVDNTGITGMATSGGETVAEVERTLPEVGAKTTSSIITLYLEADEEVGLTAGDADTGYKFSHWLPTVAKVDGTTITGSLATPPTGTYAVSGATSDIDKATGTFEPAYARGVVITPVYSSTTFSAEITVYENDEEITAHNQHYNLQLFDGDTLVKTLDGTDHFKGDGKYVVEGLEQSKKYTLKGSIVEGDSTNLVEIAEFSYAESKTTASVYYYTVTVNEVSVVDATDSKSQNVGEDFSSDKPKISVTVEKGGVTGTTTGFPSVDYNAILAGSKITAKTDAWTQDYDLTWSGSSTEVQTSGEASDDGVYVDNVGAAVVFGGTLNQNLYTVKGTVAKEDENAAGGSVTSATLKSGIYEFTVNGSFAVGDTITFSVPQSGIENTPLVGHYELEAKAATTYTVTGYKTMVEQTATTYTDPDQTLQVSASKDSERFVITLGKTTTGITVYDALDEDELAENEENSRGVTVVYNNYDETEVKIALLNAGNVNLTNGTVKIDKTVDGTTNTIYNSDTNAPVALPSSGEKIIKSTAVPSDGKFTLATGGGTADIGTVTIPTGLEVADSATYKFTFTAPNPTAGQPAITAEYTLTVTVNPVTLDTITISDGTGADTGKLVTAVTYTDSHTAPDDVSTISYKWYQSTTKYTDSNTAVSVIEGLDEIEGETGSTLDPSKVDPGHYVYVVAKGSTNVTGEVWDIADYSAPYTGRVYITEDGDPVTTNPTLTVYLLAENDEPDAGATVTTGTSGLVTTTWTDDSTKDYYATADKVLSPDNTYYVYAETYTGSGVYEYTEKTISGVDQNEEKDGYEEFGSATVPYFTVTLDQIGVDADGKVSEITDAEVTLSDGTNKATFPEDFKSTYPQLSATAKNSTPADIDVSTLPVLSGTAVTIAVAVDPADDDIDYTPTITAKVGDNSSTVTSGNDVTVNDTTTVSVVFDQVTYPVDVDIPDTGLATLAVTRDSKTIYATATADGSFEVPMGTYSISVTAKTGESFSKREHSWQNSAGTASFSGGSFAIAKDTTANTLTITVNNIENVKVFTPKVDEPNVKADEPVVIPASYDINASITYGGTLAGIVTLIGADEYTFTEVKAVNTADEYSDGVNDPEENQGNFTLKQSDGTNDFTGITLTSGDAPTTMKITFANVDSNNDPLPVGTYTAEYDFYGIPAGFDEETLLATYTVTVEITPASLTAISTDKDDGSVANPVDTSAVITVDYLTASWGDGTDDDALADEHKIIDTTVGGSGTDESETAKTVGFKWYVSTDSTANPTGTDKDDEITTDVSTDGKSLNLSNNDAAYAGKYIYVVATGSDNYMDDVVSAAIPVKYDAYIVVKKDSVAAAPTAEHLSGVDEITLDPDTSGTGGEITAGKVTGAGNEGVYFAEGLIPDKTYTILAPSKHDGTAATTNTNVTITKVVADDSATKPQATVTYYEVEVVDPSVSHAMSTIETTKEINKQDGATASIDKTNVGFYLSDQTATFALTHTGDANDYAFTWSGGVSGGTDSGNSGTVKVNKAAVTVSGELKQRTYDTTIKFVFIAANDKTEGKVDAYTAATTTSVKVAEALATTAGDDVTADADGTAVTVKLPKGVYTVDGVVGKDSTILLGYLDLATTATATNATTTNTFTVDGGNDDGIQVVLTDGTYVLDPTAPPTSEEDPFDPVWPQYDPPIDDEIVDGDKLALTTTIVYGTDTVDNFVTGFTNPNGITLYDVNLTEKEGSDTPPIGVVAGTTAGDMTGIVPDGDDTLAPKKGFEYAFTFDPTNDSDSGAYYNAGEYTATYTVSAATKDGADAEDTMQYVIKFVIEKAPLEKVSTDRDAADSVVPTATTTYIGDTVKVDYLSAMYGGTAGETPITVATDATYQWYVSTDNNANYNDVVEANRDKAIEGETGTSLTLSDNDLAGKYIYVVATGAEGSNFKDDAVSAVIPVNFDAAYIVNVDDVAVDDDDTKPATYYGSYTVKLVPQGGGITVPATYDTDSGTFKTAAGALEVGKTYDLMVSPITGVGDDSKLKDIGDVSGRVTDDEIDYYTVNYNKDVTVTTPKKFFATNYIDANQIDSGLTATVPVGESLTPTKVTSTQAVVSGSTVTFSLENNVVGNPDGAWYQKQEYTLTWSGGVTGSNISYDDTDNHKKTLDYSAKVVGPITTTLNQKLYTVKIGVRGAGSLDTVSLATSGATTPNTETATGPIVASNTSDSIVTFENIPKGTYTVGQTVTTGTGTQVRGYMNNDDNPNIGADATPDVPAGTVFTISELKANDTAAILVAQPDLVLKVSDTIDDAYKNSTKLEYSTEPESDSATKYADGTDPVNGGVVRTITIPYGSTTDAISVPVTVSNYGQLGTLYKVTRTPDTSGDPNDKITVTGDGFTSNVVASLTPNDTKAGGTDEASFTLTFPMHNGTNYTDVGTYTETFTFTFADNSGADVGEAPTLTYTLEIKVEPAKVTGLHITNITVPVTGNPPNPNGSLYPDSNKTATEEDYVTTDAKDVASTADKNEKLAAAEITGDITWADAAGTTITTADKFKPGTVYVATVTIDLDDKDNYLFTSGTTVNKPDGAEKVEAKVDEEDDGTLIVTITYPPTIAGAVEVTAVDFGTNGQQGNVTSIKAASSTNLDFYYIITDTPVDDTTLNGLDADAKKDIVTTTVGTTHATFGNVKFVSNTKGARAGTVETSGTDAGKAVYNGTGKSDDITPDPLDPGTTYYVYAVALPADTDVSESEDNWKGKLSAVGKDDFKTWYKVVMKAADNGGGTTSPVADTEHYVEDGAYLEIKADPNDNYTFGGWGAYQILSDTTPVGGKFSDNTDKNTANDNNRDEPTAYFFPTTNTLIKPSYIGQSDIYFDPDNGVIATLPMTYTQGGTIHSTELKNKGVTATSGTINFAITVTKDGDGSDHSDKLVVAPTSTTTSIEPKTGSFTVNIQTAGSGTRLDPGKYTVTVTATATNDTATATFELNVSATDIALMPQVATWDINGDVLTVSGKTVATDGNWTVTVAHGGALKEWTTEKDDPNEYDPIKYVGTADPADGQTDPDQIVAARETAYGTGTLTKWDSDYTTSNPNDTFAISYEDIAKFVKSTDLDTVREAGKKLWFVVRLMGANDQTDDHYDYLRIDLIDSTPIVYEVNLSTDDAVGTGNLTVTSAFTVTDKDGDNKADADSKTPIDLTDTNVFNDSADSKVFLDWYTSDDDGTTWTHVQGKANPLKVTGSTPIDSNSATYTVPQTDLGKIIKVVLSGNGTDYADYELTTPLTGDEATYEHPVNDTVKTKFLVTVQQFGGDDTFVTQGLGDNQVAPNGSLNIAADPDDDHVFRGWLLDEGDGTTSTTDFWGYPTKTGTAFTPTENSTLTAHFGKLPSVTDASYDIGSAAPVQPLPSITYTNGSYYLDEYTPTEHLNKPTIVTIVAPNGTKLTLTEGADFTLEPKSKTDDSEYTFAILAGDGTGATVGIEHFTQVGDYLITFGNTIPDAKIDNGVADIPANVTAKLTISKTQLVLEAIKIVAAQDTNTAITNPTLGDTLYTYLTRETTTLVPAADAKTRGVTYKWEIDGGDGSSLGTDSSYTDDGTSLVAITYRVTATSNGDYYAVGEVSDTITLYLPKYTVKVKDSTGGTATPDDIVTVDKGQSVGIVAKPNDGYVFTGWTITSGGGKFGADGTAQSSSNTAFFPNQNTVLTPNFALGEITFTGTIKDDEEYYLGEAIYYTKLDTAIVTVSASSTAGEGVTYSLSDKTGKGYDKFFTIDPTTGVITAKDKVGVNVGDSDYDKVMSKDGEIRLTVTATSSAVGTNTKDMTVIIDVLSNPLKIEGVLDYDNGGADKPYGNDSLDDSRLSGLTVKAEVDATLAKSDYKWTMTPTRFSTSTKDYTFTAKHVQNLDDDGPDNNYNYIPAEIKDEVEVQQSQYDISIFDEPDKNVSSSQTLTYPNINLTDAKDVTLTVKNTGTHPLYNVTVSIESTDDYSMFELTGTPTNVGTLAGDGDEETGFILGIKDDQSLAVGETYTVTVKVTGNRVEDNTTDQVSDTYTLTITTQSAVIDSIHVNAEAPTAGKTPNDLNVTESDNRYKITGTPVWYKQDPTTSVWTAMTPTEKFVEGGNYKVVVDVEPESGYVFRTPLLSATVNTTTNDADEVTVNTATKVIIGEEFSIGLTKFDIKVSVDAPVKGAAPAVPTESDDRYEIAGYTWYDSTGKALDPTTDKFAAGAQYTLKVDVDVTGGFSNKNVNGRYLYDLSNALLKGTFSATAGGKGYAENDPRNVLWYTWTINAEQPSNPTPPAPSTPKYEVTYVPGPNGTTDDPTTEEVREGGKPKDVPEITPIDDEHVFIGWITTDPETLGEDETITTINPEDVVINGPTEFFAVVTKRDIKVTYELGSFGTTTDPTEEIVAKYQYPSFTPNVTIIESQQDLATFVGWSLTKPDHVLEVDLVDPLTVQILKDTVFYAVYEITEYEYHEHYMIGYPDGNFEPDQDITRAEVATIIARAVLPDFIEASWYGDGGYTDMQGDHWAKSAIAFVTTAGIFEGYEDNTFRPNQPITRQEYATVIARLKGLLDGSREDLAQFIDYDEISDWAIDGVYTCVEEGWIIGYEDETFRARKDITRAEAAKMMNGYLNRGVDEPGVSTIPSYIQFPDLYWGHWAYWEVAEAVNDHYYYYYYVDGEGNDTPPEQWVIEAGYLNVKLDDSDPDNTKNVRRSDPIYVNSVNAGTGTGTSTNP